MLAADDAVAAALSARNEGAGLTDTEQLQLRTMQLEEHCRVLEQLLEVGCPCLLSFHLDEQ